MNSGTTRIYFSELQENRQGGIWGRYCTVPDKNKEFAQILGGGLQPSNLPWLRLRL